VAVEEGEFTLGADSRARGGEDLLGPDNTSGQQWDSWWAVFGPRNSNGNPAALVDPATGTINTALLDSVRQYDIGERFRNAPEQYGPLFRQNIRLVVGTADNFYLNEAVMLLKTDLDRRWPPQLPDTERGYIEFVPGADHGTVFQSPKVRQFPDEMVSHLDRHGLGPAAKAPEAK
jgi:hypothetical protein